MTLFIKPLLAAIVLISFVSDSDAAGNILIDRSILRHQLNGSQDPAKKTKPQTKPAPAAERGIKPRNTRSERDQPAKMRAEQDRPEHATPEHVPAPGETPPPPVHQPTPPHPHPDR